MKKPLKKPNSSAGFTLAETLIAVVILVMITAAAMPAAVSAYRNAVDAANAQVLLSTTVNALRSELSTAWNVDVDADGTTITYHSADTGDESVISLESDSIMLQEYAIGEKPEWWGESTDEKPSIKRPLVSNAMRQTTRNSAEKMAVTYGGGTQKVVVPDDGMFITIPGLMVKRGDSVLAEMPDTGLVIRIMSAKATDDSD